jgi:hypothetical protein
MATYGKPAATESCRDALGDRDPGVYLNLGSGLAVAIVFVGVSDSDATADSSRDASHAGIALDQRVHARSL